MLLELQLQLLAQPTVRNWAASSSIAFKITSGGASWGTGLEMTTKICAHAEYQRVIPRKESPLRQAILQVPKVQLPSVRCWVPDGSTSLNKSYVGLWCSDIFQETESDNLQHSQQHYIIIFLFKLPTLQFNCFQQRCFTTRLTASPEEKNLWRADCARALRPVGRDGWKKQKGVLETPWPTTHL